MKPAAPDRLRSVALAVFLAALFSATWVWRDWVNLSSLQLPDTDDVVRLQQVRDWMGGQRWSDLAQHRLGGEPGGLAMHWSRLPDLVPGGLIAVLTPGIGAPAAELVAVIVWPALLFAAALAMVGHLARVQLASAPTAILVAALAFPATALFLPGRIDHHGLQLVLLLAVVAALLHPRGIASGVGMALASVASLVIGLETAPFVALAAGLVVLGWVVERAGSARHLCALGATFAVALLAARAGFASDAWAYPGCDGFTRQLWLAASIGAGALLTLAALGRFVVGIGPRLVLAGALGGLAALAATLVAPACTNPYGGVDAALAARWLAKVGEAQSWASAPAATIVGQCGLLLAGLAATGWAAWRTRDPGWVILLLFQLTAFAISLVQLRGANAGALLAAPALAAAIGAARRRGALALVATWIASAGILYPLAADALLARSASDPAPASADCSGPAALATLATLAPARVVAPIDFGAWGLAATHHSFLAAPYHRNNLGNAAAFAILDGPAPRARAIAARWHARYLAVCAGQPGWWHGTLPLITQGGGLQVYAFVPLPPPAPGP